MHPSVDPDELEKMLLTLTPVDFERFFIDVLFANSERFSNICPQLAVDGVRKVDVFATDNARDGVATYFEVKFRKVLFRDILRAVADTAERIHKLNPGARFVLVVPGLPTTEVAALAKSEHGIEIWGKLSLASLVTPGLMESYRRQAAMRGPSKPRDDEFRRLADELNGIRRGRSHAHRYQSHIIDVFEKLFVPPLAAPRIEHADGERRNRRDAVFENIATDGFWERMRRTYAAEYIVLDAKNNVNGPDKKCVVSAAHYLKPYGCGMFAIVVGRTDPTKAALHAAREQWIGGQKMILLVSEKEVMTMLDLARQGSYPEEVLQRNITNFRLSL